VTETRPPSIFSKITRAAILVGMACVGVAVGALYILSDARLRSTIVVAPLAIGLILFLLGVLCNLRWLWQRVRRRRFLLGLNVWAMVFLALVVLTVANVIVVKTPETESWYLDCTADRLFTLSEKSRNILDGLTQDLRIVNLVGSGTVSFEGQGSVNIAKRVKDMLGVYRAASPRIRTETIDFYREKLRAEQVAQRFGRSVGPDTLLIESGGVVQTLSYFDLVRTEGFAPVFLGEEKITAAILALSQPRPSNVCFLVGHGEMGPQGPEDAALGKFADALRGDNCRVETLNLRRAGRMPDACDLLVIAGPTAAFEQSETDTIRDWLAGGGRLLVLARPNAVGGRMTGLDTLLGEHNVHVDDRRIAIEVYRNVPDLRVVVQDFGKHPITEGLRNINCLLARASPAAPLLNAESDARLTSPYEVTTLLRSSAQSWAEADIASSPMAFTEGRDTRGPLSLAVAAERRKPKEADGKTGMRIVVIGSTDVAMDEAFETYVGNRALMTNSAAWLMDTERKLGIPPQPSAQRRLKEDETAWKIVFVIVVLGMPAAAMAAGLGVWAVRRRA